jgi:hypothetical protein
MEVGEGEHMKKVVINGRVLNENRLKKDKEWGEKDEERLNRATDGGRQDIRRRREDERNNTPSPHGGPVKKTRRGTTTTESSKRTGKENRKRNNRSRVLNEDRQRK